jgi:hypothetical protein
MLGKKGFKSVPIRELHIRSDVPQHLKWNIPTTDGMSSQNIRFAYCHVVRLLTQLQNQTTFQLKCPSDWHKSWVPVCNYVTR